MRGQGMGKAGVGAALVAAALLVGGCQSFWRMVDKDVVALHQDKVAYMEEFRAEEAKYFTTLQQVQALKPPKPELELQVMGRYLRASQGFLEGLNRSLRFVREHQKEIARSELVGLDLKALEAEQTTVMARHKALQTKRKALLLAHPPKP